MRERMGEIEELRARRAVGSLAVAEGERGIRRLRWAVRRMAKSERLEELRVEVVRVFLSSHFLDHHAKQHVPGVVVAVGRPGREVERVGGDELDNRIRRKRFAPCLRPTGRGRVTVNARRVIQQLSMKPFFPARKLRPDFEVIIGLFALFPSF